MSVRVIPKTLNGFADNVLDPVSANFVSVNDYVDTYCQGGGPAQNPGSSAPDGSTGAIAQAINKVAESLVEDYHTYIRPGAQRLAGTANVLRSSATLYQQHDDDNAQRIWTVGQHWRTPGDYHRHHANGGGSAFLPGIIDRWWASDHVPKARAQVSDTLTKTDGIAAWIDDMLAAAGLERFVVNAVKLVVGDYAVPWRNSDAWGKVVTAFDAMNGDLKKWGAVLSDQWDGSGGRAFDYDMFDRWCPALEGARRIAYSSQQDMQTFASLWQSLYETTFNLVDLTAGLLRNVIAEVGGVLLGAEKLIKVAHEVKEKWDSLMQMSNDLVELARNVINGMTARWATKDLFIYTDSPLNTFKQDY